MKKVLVLSVLCPLLMTGCATPAPPSSNAAPVHFLCDGGAALTVAFDQGTAVVDGPEGRVTMTASPVASGFEYVDGDSRIRGKGTQLTWSPKNGAPVSCREDRASMQQPQVQPQAPALAGTTWTLVAFESSDDAIGRTVPPQPERYRMSFLADGNLALQLDCNRARGRWEITAPSSTGGSLALQGGAMTRAMCQPGAWDTRIARDLSHIRSFTLRDGKLFLALEADGGIYEFSPAQVDEAP